ncbi:MAG TPA: M20/M25/M40 family metallo-hydrolase [Ardenticatenaceae bacterium]|jgi:acetylornithine deacetylase/succinyl-diaminopimelate desuccinylase-like protein
MSIQPYVETNQERLIAELADYCAIPSVAAEGRGIAEASAWVAARLQTLGARVEILPTAGSPVVYAELGPADAPRTLLIYNHYDVQPADPYDLWHSDPFTLTERDGNLYARGTADNKANFLSRVHAIEAWQATRGALPLRVRWVIEGEEEIGSPNLTPFAEQEGHRWADSDGCLWEAGYKNENEQMQLYSGLKGIAYFELRAYGANADKHSSFATLLPNPAWRLVWTLDTLKAPDETILIEGLMEHVAAPTEAERRYLAQIPFDDEALRRTHGVEGFVTGVTGYDALLRHLYQPTCTICGIQSGYTGPGGKTVLPHYAFAKLDFRLVPNLTPELVHDLLRQHLDRHGFSDIQIIAEEGEHPVKGQVESEVVRAALSAIERVTGTPPTLWPNMAATGPMHPVTAQFGIPAVGFGVGYYGSNTHAPNEHIRRADYLQGIEVAAAFFETFAQQA